MTSLPGKNYNMFNITDLIQASVEVDQPHQLQEAFDMLNNISKSTLRIIKIENNLNTPLKNVMFNFIFNNQIIGEIYLICKNDGAKTSTNMFLYELTQASNFDHFK